MAHMAQSGLHRKAMNVIISKLHLQGCKEGNRSYELGMTPKTRTRMAISLSDTYVVMGSRGIVNTVP